MKMGVHEVNGSGSQVNDVTVLIADRDLETVRQLQERFYAMGFRVFSVDSGREAVSCARKRKIDIAVVDADLKDMMGFTVVPLIKDINKKTRVIMTTVKNSIDLESRCRETGIVYYAIKCFVVFKPT